MKKYHLVLAVLVTALVLLGISEGVKAKNRKMALETLNQVYPSLKTENEKVAAVVRADTLIKANQSMFDFSTSSAHPRRGGPGSRNSGQAEEEGGIDSGGGFSGEFDPNPSGVDVTTPWTWELIIWETQDGSWGIVR